MTTEQIINVALIVSTLALTIVTAVADDMMGKLIQILSGGRVREALRYQARHGAEGRHRG